MDIPMLRTLASLYALCLAISVWAGNPPTPPTAAPETAVITRYQIHTDHSGSAPNWFTGQLEAVGIGYADAKGEQGKFDAQAMAQTIMRLEAARAVNALSIDGQATLGSLTDADMPQLRAQLLDGLTIIDETWRDGAYTVVGVLPLYGPSGASALGVRRAVLAGPLTEVAVSELALVSAIPSGHTPQQYAEPYTGVIVNCDAVLISPCLYPSLLRTDGKPFWGPITEPNPLLAANGQIHYAPDLHTALQQGLAGKRPLIITAVGAGKGCHPVMNIDDVFLVLQQQKHTDLLQRKPVVVTLGE